LGNIRMPLLILSVWGLIHMLGFLFGMLIRPHAIGPAGIRVRYGSEIDIPQNQQGHAVRRRLSGLHERGAARETWIT
jgi:hypothetical protein